MIYIMILFINEIIEYSSFIFLYLFIFIFLYQLYNSFRATRILNADLHSKKTSLKHERFLP